MSTEKNGLSRKKFISWGVGITSLLAVPAFLKPKPEKKEKKIVKMLGEDGKLVSVEIEHIPSDRKKIKAEDIHSWIKENKKTL